MTDWQIAIVTLVGFTLIGIIIHSIFEAARNLKPVTFPVCFATKPGPQEQAEFDCLACPFANICLDWDGVLAPNPLLDDLTWKPVPEGGYRYEPRHRLPEIKNV